MAASKESPTAFSPDQVCRPASAPARMPELVRNPQQIYDEWYDRKHNGLAKSGAVRKSGKNLLLVIPLYVNWKLTRGEQDARS